MEHNQITKEWIDQQRENIQNAHRPFSPQRETARERIIFSTHETSINALEDSLKREADKDTEIARLKRSLSASRAFGSRLENIIGKRRKAILVDALHFTNAENIRLTAERDAEKKRADVAEHKIYEIAHTGLCGVCEQSFSVCDGHETETKNPTGRNATDRYAGLCRHGRSRDRRGRGVQSVPS